MILCQYVDDILIFGTSLNVIMKSKYLCLKILRLRIWEKLMLSLI